MKSGLGTLALVNCHMAMKKGEFVTILGLDSANEDGREIFERNEGCEVPLGKLSTKSLKISVFVNR